MRAAELVTGEHSGLANLIPGNPGTIDPPGLEEAFTSNRGGTLAAGTYDYAITASSTNGETIPSITTLAVGGRTMGSARLRWDAICHATRYRIYRRSAGVGAWALVGTVAQPVPAFRNGGPVSILFRDLGAAGSAATPPSTNGALIDPYGQNPAFAEALRVTGVRYIGSDASKPYPQTATSTTGPQWPANTSFMNGTARMIPRYPTNVYYNVATEAQLTDEYNHLYLPPWLGGVCVNSAVTTCRETPATWEEIVAAESQRMFGHMMGNDPRPHYFHQTNLAQSSTPGGGVLYPVLDALRDQYATYFNATSPTIQLTQTQIGELLARQEAWATASTRSVTGYLEGARVTITNSGAAAATIPLTGTEAGTVYGGSRSGWVNAARGRSTHTAATAWPAETPPPPPAAPTTLTTVTTTLTHAVDALTAGRLDPVADPLAP